MGDAQASSAQQPPNDLLCSLASKIQGVMDQKELGTHQWLKIEQFVSEKARELRTERLKRNLPTTADVVQSSAVPRKILKVKQRH